MTYVSENLKMTKQFGIFNNHEWAYDGLDDAAGVNSSGFFSDGADRGMQIGDRVLCTQWTTAVPTGGHPAPTDVIASRFWVEVVQVSAAGVVDVSNGDALTLTDSD